MKAIIVKFLFIIALVFSGASIAGSINWNDYSSSIFTDAKAQNKPVIIFAMADACHWCHQMKEDVFSDDQVSNLINDNFYPVMLHADKERVAAKQYGLTGVPDILFFDINGKLTNVSQGFIETAVMTKKLKAMLPKSS